MNPTTDHERAARAPFFFFILPCILAAFLSCERPSAAEAESRDISYLKKYQQGDLPDSLIQSTLEIREKALASDDWKNLRVSTVVLASRYAGGNNHAEAMKLLDEMVAKAEEGDNETEMAQAYYSTGVYYFSQGLSWVAVEYFSKMLTLARLGDKERFNAMYAMGQASSISLEATRGISVSECYAEAEKIARRMNDSTCLSMALFGRSQTLFDALGAHKTKDEPLSEGRRDSIRTSIALLEECNRLSPHPVWDCGLGLGHAALKEFDRGEFYVKRARKGFEESDPFPNPVGLNTAASFYMCAGDYARSLDYATESYRESARRRKEGDMRNALHILYYAAKYSGDTAGALRYYEKYNELHQRLMDKSFEHQVNLAQVRFDTRIKEDKLVAAEQRNRMYRTGIGILCAFLLVVAALAGVISVLHRKTSRAYRELVRKSQQWAAQTAAILSNDSNAGATEEQYELMERLKIQLDEYKAYGQADLTLDSLARTLGTNRSYLSEAVNKVTGSNFTQYINEYRIKEAVLLLSDGRHDRFTLDAVAGLVGFSNRNTFYQAFRRQTGLTPAEFRRNRTA